MEIQEQIKLAENILSKSSYNNQKEIINEIFKNTEDNKKEDIMLRLIVIDSCYSTNMNRRLFGFEDMVKIILSLEKKGISRKIDVLPFVEKNKDIMLEKIGIGKKGADKGHGFSLLTKYLFFRTNFNFPIYDSLVFKELKIKGKIEPSVDYFDRIIELKEKYFTSFNKLDIYFWVCGKIKKGSLSLLIDNKQDYLKMLDELNISQSEKELSNSIKFDSLIANKIRSSNIKFKNQKLNDIKTLLISLDK